MNKKVLLQDLSDRMAQRRGMTRKDADLFVRSVFEVIGEYLQADKLVKVKGLGTFKLVTVESRASVDVNTGERIVIKGYTKVSFTPDAVLRDEINKPFAQFETVVLNEGTDVDEMERVETPELPDLPESESVDDATETPAAAETAPADAATEAVSETPEETAETEQVPEDVLFETAAIEEDPAEEEPEETDAEPDAMPVFEDEAGAEPEQATEQPVREPVAESRVEPDMHVVSQQVEFQKVEHQTVENQHIVQVAPEHAANRGGLSVWAWTGICVAVLLLMCGSYYAGHEHWFCSGDCRGGAVVVPEKVESGKNIPVSVDEKKQKQKASQAQQARDSMAQPQKPVAPVVQQKPSYPQVAGGKYEITGTKEVHRLKPGETLRGLSLKYYGSKDYVDYIIVYNDIKNPDIVPVNMELKLPELTLKPR